MKRLLIALMVAAGLAVVGFQQPAQAAARGQWWECSAKAGVIFGMNIRVCCYSRTAARLKCLFACADKYKDDRWAKNRCLKTCRCTPTHKACVPAM